MIQMLIGLLVVGVIAKVVLGAVRVAQERNTDPTDVKTSHEISTRTSWISRISTSEL